MTRVNVFQLELVLINVPIGRPVRPYVRAYGRLTGPLGVDGLACCRSFRPVSDNT